MKPGQNNSHSETRPLFPSDGWEGFYTYAFGPGAGRHPKPKRDSFRLIFKI